jgi:transcription elongation factor GreA
MNKIQRGGKPHVYRRVFFSSFCRIYIVFFTLKLFFAMSSNKINYFTQEGLKALRDELHELKTKGRAKVAQDIAEAREKGDLKENAEYDAAKDAQGHLELKISKLEGILKNARVIDESNIDPTKVAIHSKVKIKNTANNAVMQYMLVSEKEADLKAGKISVESPIGKGLLGKSVGEVAEIEAPKGKIRFEIIEVSR